METMIEKFIKGTQYVNIWAAVSTKELTTANQISDDYLSQECIKFIPASGAATRMFKDLYQYLEDQQETEFIKKFFDNIEELAFFDDLKKVLNGQEWDTAEGKSQLIRLLLTDGLNYGNLPKALLKVHTYGDRSVTPIDEHIYECEQYAGKDRARLHFTISAEHELLFDQYVEKALAGKDKFEITHSFQKKSTDTLAVDMDNQPFLDENGEILYRAGGHGALIENLNDLDGDIIFIKNIDNVCHRDRVKTTIDSKKKLASIGYQVKQQIDGYIEQLNSDSADLELVSDFIENTLHIKSKKAVTKDTALGFLNRPLRVCGVVKNQGEPGGGPFVVDNGDYLDLQICEMSEIDLNDKEKKDLVSQSQFFNPVDLVCFIKDYQGQKFNLLDFTNPDRYFISEKTYRGRKLKALEHPGLWNGAMDNWNTLFVEVPLSTFNPVKTVNDLLREGHKPIKG
ncbi:DUF4301 family protein [Eubacteriaceae bacterium ES3]|nr:DUF4301 family protein [Eubacteriaceae bacterium ES3]